MKMYFIANARMPNEKAHGIQIAKMCEAFIEEGVDLMLVVPRRNMTEQLRSFYKLRVDVPIVRLSAFNLYTRGRIGYFISTFSFMITSIFFLWWKKLYGKKFVVYTVDLDNYSSSLLPCAGSPFFSEMHGGKPNTFAQRFLFQHVRGIFAINTIIIDEFKRKFPYSHTTYMAEPNGVDKEMFAPRDKQEARTKLGLPDNKKIVLYAGRFFEWKGLEILPRAARHTIDIEWYVVGGTRDEFCNIVQNEPIPSTMNFMGGQEQSMIPWWLAAADVLIVPGTKRDQQSYFYTSPMKIFEYFLSQRAIVASNTPAIQQIISGTDAFLYVPDKPEDLARKVEMALSQEDNTHEKIAHAYKLGKLHSWSARAKRILACIEQATETSI